MKNLISILAACAIGYSCAALPVSETPPSDFNQEEDSCLELKNLYAYHCPVPYQRSIFCRHLQGKIANLEEGGEGEECFCSPECQEKEY